MNVDSIIIHAGVYKTGSTAIQGFLNTNRSMLLAHTDYAYPPGFNHSAFLNCFSDDKIFNSFNRFYGISDLATIEKNNEFYFNSVNNWLESFASGKKIIFSAENFCDLSYGSMYNFKKYCRNFTDNIKIIMYARDPLGFAYSSISQHLKQGMIPDFINHGFPKIPYIDYIKKLNDVFGRESLEVLPFIKQSSSQEGVLLDFLRRIDLSNCLLNKLDFGSDNANKSLTREAVMLGEHIIKQMKFAGVELSEVSFYHYCGQYLEGILGDKFTLTNDEQIHILEDTKNDCLFLKDHFGIDFTPEVKPACESKSSINTEFIQSIGHSIGKMFAGFFKVPMDFSANYFVLIDFNFNTNGLVSLFNPLVVVVSFSISQHVNALNISLVLYNENGNLVFDVNSTCLNQTFTNLHAGCYESCIEAHTMLPPGNYHAGFSIEVDDGGVVEIARYGRLKMFTVHEESTTCKSRGKLKIPPINFALKKIDNNFYRKVNNCAGYINIVKYDHNFDKYSINLTVQIFNTSSEDWFNLDRYPINITYRIFSDSGDLIIADGERYKLPVSCLNSNENVLLDIVIYLPKVDHACKIVVLPVQESVSWFDELGFTPLVLTV